MTSIPKSYADETLKMFGTQYVNEEARLLFIKKVMEYAELLSKETDKTLKIRNGKKILPKDIELASKYI